MDKLQTMKSLSAYLKKQGLKEYIEPMKLEIRCTRSDEEIEPIEKRYRELKKGG